DLEADVVSARARLRVKGEPAELRDREIHRRRELRRRREDGQARRGEPLHVRAPIREPRADAAAEEDDVLLLAAGDGLLARDGALARLALRPGLLRRRLLAELRDGVVGALQPARAREAIGVLVLEPEIADAVDLGDLLRGEVPAQDQ